MTGFGASPKSPKIQVDRILDIVVDLASRGSVAEAIIQLESCLFGPNPKYPQSQRLFQQLAKLYVEHQRWQDAINCYATLQKNSIRQSPSSKSSLVRKLFNNAADAARAGDYERSLDLHCQLFGLEPLHLDGLRNFAVILRRIHAFADAEQVIQRYLVHRPDCPAGLNTYATILNDLGRHTEAMATLHRVLELNPASAEAACNLASEYHLKSLIDPAYAYSSRAVAIAPDRITLWLEYLVHLRRVCAFGRLASVDWWALLDSAPVDSIASSFLQVLVLAETAANQHQLNQVLSRWGDSVSVPSAGSPKPLERTISAHEPLRIGFISADFRDHSVARFIWPLFEHLDRARFQLYGYSTFLEKDAWRVRFDGSATAMRDVASLSPLELGQLVQADGIHILFDLTGFTKGSRTRAFATRMAPVQVSWLGYPGSSGLESMDYLFLDRYLAPSDPTYLREQALITPGTTVCFSGLHDVPITPQIPEKVRGCLTLGTLNNPYKFTPATLARWSRVMHALPDAQFLFVRREFQSFYLRQNLLEAFAQHGIDATRVHFYNNRLAGRHYLDCYNELDLTLDTYPVTGGTTTTDALWMGVPVVGLEGPNVHQRVCSAILHHAGHPEWIARSDDEFVQIALDLAANQSLRIQLRQTLREELKASLLCNSKQFAADFAATMDSLRPSA